MRHLGGDTTLGSFSLVYYREKIRLHLFATEPRLRIPFWFMFYWSPARIGSNGGLVQHSLSLSLSRYGKQLNLQRDSHYLPLFPQAAREGSFSFPLHFIIRTREQRKPRRTFHRNPDRQSEISMSVNILLHKSFIPFYSHNLLAIHQSTGY